ncbi:MAG: hypothetical protein HQ582_07070 [Planctomycetes bacterium]|nr:hypothetical protein [Planctomycetota bacterium]
MERPTRHLPIRNPSLIYTRGGAGSNNRQIVANEVIWCDLAPVIDMA